MVNEIKLDSNISTLLGKEGIVEHKPKQPHLPTQAESVAVTNKLSSYIKAVNVYEDPIHTTSSLEELKNQVQQNRYKIDLDVLSERLMNSGLFKKTGG